MSWIDIGIVLLIAISALVSLYRGFVREFISLATWIAAIWLAINYSNTLANYLPESLDSTDLNIAGMELALNNLRIGIAFVLVVILVLIAGGILNGIIGALIRKGALSINDRLLGLIFGAIKGGVIVVLLVMAAGLTQFPKTPWWEQSQLIQPFQEVAIWIRGYLPDDIASKFSL
jgi:membrane protein required for colicin V production